MRSIVVLAGVAPFVYLQSFTKVKLASLGDGGDVRVGEMGASMKTATWVVVLLAGFMLAIDYAVMPLSEVGSKALNVYFSKYGR